MQADSQQAGRLNPLKQTSDGKRLYNANFMQASLILYHQTGILAGGCMNNNA